MKILITGAYGSGAQYLIDYIQNEVRGYMLHGIVRWKNKESTINLHECDLTDLSSVIRTLEVVQPDYIFHLAANANVYASFHQPIAVMHNNVDSTLNLYEAIRLLKLKPKIVFCSTSECYGTPIETPIREDHPLNPINPYAVSKLTQEKLALSYFYCYGIETIVTRAFTYINPKRANIFSSAFAKQIVDIERGNKDKLYHGNLDSVRSITDVRDIMECYWVASQYCIPGEVYNIGGGHNISVGDLLDLLINKAKCPIFKVKNDALLRPTDVTMQIPNTVKFIRATGWKPRYNLDESLDWLLEYYRNQ